MSYSRPLHAGVASEISPTRGDGGRHALLGSSSHSANSTRYALVRGGDAGGDVAGDWAATRRVRVEAATRTDATACTCGRSHPVVGRHVCMVADVGIIFGFGLVLVLVLVVETGS